jgi:hypothetical protein
MKNRASVSLALARLTPSTVVSSPILTSGKRFRHHRHPGEGFGWVGNHFTRWLLAFVAIALLCAADQAYMRGRNTELAMSTVRSAVATVSREAANLLRQVRG